MHIDNIPLEIFHCILTYLDQAELASSGRVSRKWADAGREFLWRNPTKQAIWSLCQDQRLIPSDAATLDEQRDRWLRYVRGLHFDDPPWSRTTKHPLFAGLVFPNLRELTLARHYDFEYKNTPQWLLQEHMPEGCLQTYLRKLTLGNCALSPDFFEILLQKCSNLEAIILDDITVQPLFEKFLAYLRRASKLQYTKVTTLHEEPQEWPEEWLMAVIKLMEPRQVHLQKPCQAVDRYLYGLDHPLQSPVTHLRALHTTCDSTSAKKLQFVVPNLEHLEINICERSPEIFAHITCLKHLRCLYITSDVDAYFDLPVEYMLRLKDLKILEELAIKRNNIRLLEWTPSSQTNFFSSFPYLKLCELEIEAPLGMHTLIALGRYSPHIERVLLEQVYSRYSLQELLQSKSPLFPCLRFLTVHTVYFDHEDYMDEKRLSQVIQEYFPKLEDILCYYRVKGALRSYGGSPANLMGHGEIRPIGGSSAGSTGIRL